MKRLPCIILLLLMTSGWAYAYTDVENQRIKKQFEEFLHQRDDAGKHQPLTDNNQLAEAYLVYGNKALDDGDVEAAIRTFKSGQELLPEDGRFSLMLGVSYRQLAKNSLAEIYLQDARHQLPDDDRPLILLADLYYHLGQLDQTEYYLLQLLERNPGDENISRRLAQIRLEMEIEQEMDRDVNSIFTVRFDGAFRAELAELAIETLQDAYTEQGSLLNHYPQNRIIVILYTRDDFDLATGAPHWVGGRFDGKIRIPVSSETFSPDIFRFILRHEYNHFLAHQVSLGRAPVWFYEGLAVLAENSGALRNPVILPDAVREEGLLDFSAIERNFSHLGERDVLLAYEQSHSFVRYLEQQFGWHSLRDLLDAFSRGLPVDEAFASVFGDFGLSYADLQSEWLGSL